MGFPRSGRIDADVRPGAGRSAGLELDVIAAMVFGGGSLKGREGSILGSLISAMIMTIIRTGCQLNGWAAWVTHFVTGAVIVLAVTVDQLPHRQVKH